MRKVSVIIPGYREDSRLFKACIQSVINQSYSNFKIYIVLDSAASGIVKKTAKELGKNKKINVLQDSNRGAASHRNLGVKESWKYADYFAFTDGDCIADKNWLKNLVECIEKQGGKIGCVGGINISNEKKLIAKSIQCAESSFMGGGGVSGQTTIQKKVKKVNSVPNCNALYKKECWVNNKQDLRFIKGQDGEFNLRLAKQGWKFVQTPKAIIYHKREDKLSGYIKKIYYYGKAAAKIIKKHGFYGLRRFWYSIGITGYYLLLVVLIISTIVNSSLWPILIVYAGLYTLGLIIAGIVGLKRSSILVCLTSIFILILQHISYSFGFLSGLV